MTSLGRGELSEVQAMSRAEKEAVASKLRSEGLLLRQIAERMGVAISTVDAWLNDPGGRRLQARKDSYCGTCVVCGGPTSGCNGRDAASELCQDCRNWTDDEMVEAMQTWATAHGGIPPTVEAWVHADVDHPSSRTFGGRHIGWNEALLRAGFSLRCDRRPETQDWVMEQVRAGVPTAEIAQALGVTPRAIQMRFEWRGLNIKDVRRVAA